MIGVARSRWLTGMCRSAAMPTSTVTTTYASSEASSTAAPAAPMARPRPGRSAVSRSSTGVRESAGASGGTDVHARVVVRHGDGDGAALGPARAGHREHRLAQQLVGLVDPDLSGHAIADAGHHVA